MLSCCIKYLFCQFLTTVMLSDLHAYTCCIHRLERIHFKFLSLLPPSNASDLNITLAEYQTYCMTIQVFKILHNVSPTYLQGLFFYTSNVTGHIGRRLYVPGIRTNYGNQKHCNVYCYICCTVLYVMSQGIAED